MASKSQTFEIVLTANGSAVTEVMEELQNLAKGYADELDKLTEKKRQGIKLTNEEEERAESLTKKIQGLNTAWERNAIELRKVDEIMKDLTQATGNEMGRALKTLSARFKRAKSDAVDDLIKIKEQMQDVRHEMSKREGVDALKKAKATLTDLANTPLDKLKMGLDSIEKKLATMSEAERQASEGLQLLEGKKRYQAQIAVMENGRAGTTPISGMNTDQLRAEQQRLRAGYMSTDGVKGYETVSQEYLNRLQKVNQLIKERTDAERESIKATKEAEQVELRRLEFARQGQETSKTLANMDKASYEDLENALRHLEEQRQKYIKAGDTKHIQRNLQMQDKLKQKQLEMQKLMLTDQQISDRVNNSKKYNVIQLQQAYDQLKYKLTTLATEETKAIKETRRQMKSLEKDIKAVSGEATGLTKIWKTAVRNISTYMGVFAVAGFLKNKIQGIVKDNLALSDSMAQVQKVTGLTSKEIQRLNFNLAKLDTRTTLTQLNELAYSAGKMGLGKYGMEGVEGFVRAANQLQVALGDDLGASVEEAITPLAKLAENLGLIQKMGVEKSMMAIGSSINELSQTTTATGKNIVDFARRIQPAAQMIGLTTDEILALGSASDSFGISSEISATSFTKFLAAYRTNTAEIEKILSMVPGTLDKFFDEGRTIDGLMAIFQRMHEIGDLRYLEEAFKALGSEGSRMFTTFGAFSKNIDMFREHLITSNEAFAEAVSVTEEFNLVQATAEGIIERANNMWQNAFVNPEGVDTIKQLAEGWYNLTKQLTESTNWLTGVKTSLEMIAWVASNLLKILPELTKAMFFFGVAKAIRYITTEVHIMNTAMAAAATTAGKLSAVLRSNVWILAATAIALVGAKLYDMAKASQEAADKLDVLQEAEKDAEDESRKQRVELKKLYEATKDQTKSIEERKDALRKMVGDEKYNQYYKQLSNEKDLATAAAGAYRDLTEEIFRSAQARAYAHKIEELENKRMEKEDEKAKKEKWRDENKGSYEAGKREYQNQQNYVDDVTGGATAGFAETQIARRGAAAMKPKIIDEYEETERVITNIDNDIKGIDADMDKLKDRIRGRNLTPEPAGGGGGGGGGDTGGGTTKAPEWMVEEKKEAEKATKAVIGAIEEFYRLQEAAANELAANGQLKGADFERMVQYIQDRKDKMLLEARRAIVGDPNEFENIRKELSGDIIKRDDAVSQAAMQRIQQAEPAKQGAVLRKYNGSDAVFGLDSNAWLNDVRKGAAQNELNIQRRQAKMVEEMDKLLMQYEYVNQAQRSFGDELVKLGLVTNGYDKVVQQLADGTEIVANTKDVEALSSKVTGLGTRLFNVDMDDAEELRNLVNAIMHTVDEDGKKVRESFAQMFPRLDEWMAQPEAFKQQMQAFYRSLLDYDTAYYEARKRNYDLYKKQNQQMWDESGRKDAYEQTYSILENQQKMQNVFGAGQTFAQQYGFADVIANDPEVKLYQEKLRAAAEYYQFVQNHQHTEQELREAGQSTLNAFLAIAQKVSTEVAERASKIQELSQPIADFAENAGQKIGDMMFNMESQSMTWNQIWKNMVSAMAKSTIQMGTQWLQQKIQQALFYKQLEMDESLHQATMTTIALGGAMARMEGEAAIGTTSLAVKSATDSAQVAEEVTLATILTHLGISEGAAKIIGTLGWWGIPLIGVISSLLLGLLASALSTTGKSSEAKSSSANKVKLKSGMLTYDEGNVQTVVGDDGRVYRAREQRSLPSGVSMITEPIATTVNGQQALVGERGPEIVIGRKTTRAIQMNRPDLLRDLVRFDKGLTTRKARTFDEGNLQDLASAIRPEDGSTTVNAGTDASAERQALLDRMDKSDALMAQVLYFLQNPVAPNINMYGRGGLHEKMQQANQFYKRYEDKR